MNGRIGKVHTQDDTKKQNCCVLLAIVMTTSKDYRGTLKRLSCDDSGINDIKKSAARGGLLDNYEITAVIMPCGKGAKMDRTKSSDIIDKIFHGELSTKQDQKVYDSKMRCMIAIRYEYDQEKQDPIIADNSQQNIERWMYLAANREDGDEMLCVNYSLSTCAHIVCVVMSTQDGDFDDEDFRDGMRDALKKQHLQDFSEKNLFGFGVSSLSTADKLAKHISSICADARMLIKEGQNIHTVVGYCADDKGSYARRPIISCPDDVDLKEACLPSFIGILIDHCSRYGDITEEDVYDLAREFDKRANKGKVVFCKNAAKKNAARDKAATNKRAELEQLKQQLLAKCMQVEPRPVSQSTEVSRLDMPQPLSKLDQMKNRRDRRKYAQSRF